MAGARSTCAGSTVDLDAPVDCDRHGQGFANSIWVNPGQAQVHADGARA